MVAGKVKAAMGFQKSPSTPKLDLPRRPSSSPASTKAPPSSNSNNKSGTVFSRSFGVYFPKSSAQVQPRPPDVADLLRLIEELQERESRLRIELLEQKLLKETVAIVPILEKELALKSEELDRCRDRIHRLEDEGRIKDEKVMGLEAEIEELKRPNLLKSLRVGRKSIEIAPVMIQEARNVEVLEKKDEEVEAERKEISNPRTPRIPKPPPLPSTSSSSSSSSSSSASGRVPCPPVAAPLPPPPPPPPPAKGMKATGTCVRRVPEVVEFYHSLMRRDSKRESGGGATDLPSAANTRNMIGEIENRSTHLLAIKNDVEMQGDLIRFLIKEVNNAAFTNIQDLVAFVKWLDDELSFLVDERAVLKHFDWPEHKADAMREAAFGYRDLKKLELEASTFRDDRRQSCSSDLKKMQALLEKLEHGVYTLSRLREGAMKKYKGFQIPWEWMRESGFVCQIKLASVKLSMKYMRRVSAELEAIAGGPEEEELMLQGVRFAFRVHQFAGGFDIETMRAFQELRDKSISLQSQKQSQEQQQQLQQQKLFNRSMSLFC